MNAKVAHDHDHDHEEAADTEEAVPESLTRDEIRRRLLGNIPKPEHRRVTLFGVDLEIRQPPLKAIMQARQTTDAGERAADMIVKYTYIPGTDTLVFEDSDKEMILRWPFGKDFIEFQNAIIELTGIDIGKAEEEVEADPFSG